ncbi:MAG TPA: hypothetical protein VF594_06545 [Rubricoccaceae bacterium]|jgi:hypothetical protein
MWPLVAWLLLFPLTLPASDWLTARAGRVPGTPSPSAMRATLALYLTVAIVLAAHAFLR